MYKTKVNQHEGATLFPDSDAIKNLDIQKDGENGFHVIHQNKSYKVRLLKHDKAQKQLSLMINGNKYDVQLEDEYDALLKSMGMGAGATKKIKNLKAPMPGLVLDIMVEPGKEVAKDEPIMILEAMKMENVLKSPGDVVIKSVEIEKGLAVDKNQVLINFE